MTPYTALHLVEIYQNDLLLCRIFTVETIQWANFLLASYAHFQLTSSISKTLLICQLFFKIKCRNLNPKAVWILTLALLQAGWIYWNSLKIDSSRPRQSFNNITRQYRPRPTPTDLTLSGKRKGRGRVRWLSGVKPAVSVSDLYLFLVPSLRDNSRVNFNVVDDILVKK